MQFYNGKAFTIHWWTPDDCYVIIGLTQVLSYSIATNLQLEKSRDMANLLVANDVLRF